MIIQGRLFSGQMRLHLSKSALATALSVVCRKYSKAEWDNPHEAHDGVWTGSLQFTVKQAHHNWGLGSLQFTCFCSSLRAFGRGENLLRSGVCSFENGRRLQGFLWHCCITIGVEGQSQGVHLFRPCPLEGF